MSDVIALISNDSDFFEFIKPKLELRKSDDIQTYKFDEVKAHKSGLNEALLILNSESAKEETISLLGEMKGTPAIVTVFNDDDAFKKKCYRAGALDFLPILTPDSEFRARMIPALTITGMLKKNKLYRDLLVKKKVIDKDNEIFIEYENLIDNVLEDINNRNITAVFGAIAPSDKTNFMLPPNMIEGTILKNLRINDILLSYAQGKYFLILPDSDIDTANRLWAKIQPQISQKLYAGFTQIANKNRQQIINEALNKLHTEITKDGAVSGIAGNPVTRLNSIAANSEQYGNFKLFRQEFGKKIEQVITPVFYQMQQKYAKNLTGITMEQGTGEGYGTFYIKGKHSSSCLRITSPGFSKINIDITYTKTNGDIDAKRITLEPEELEAGLLGDILEQFISDYKRSIEYDI